MSDFWKDYEPELTRAVQQALDKKAENARELGLDYEPVWDNLPSNKDVEDAMRIKRLNQLATPPAAQRQWTGLTDEEIDHTEWIPKRGSHITYDIGWLDNMKIFARAIEAKLKEKNT